MLRGGYKYANSYFVLCEIIEHLHPNAVFHHDDWGSQKSTFLAPEMFRTFFLEPYKKIYIYWKQHGAELVIHHSDSFAATLVPQTYPAC